MSSLQDTQLDFDMSAEHNAIRDEEPHAGHERSASPPWGSWHNVSMQHQQEAGDVPDSPRSTGDWELLNAAASSGHGSSSRLTHTEEDKDLTASAAELPQLHITLTPQGSSAITMRLEPVSNAASPTKSAGPVEEHLQQQLRKAKETLLPVFSMHQPSALQEPVQQSVEAAAEALPTSIHLSMQADTSDSNVDSPHANEAFHSTGVADLTEPASATETDLREHASATETDAATTASEVETAETASEADARQQTSVIPKHASGDQEPLHSQHHEGVQHESASLASTEPAEEEEHGQDYPAGQEPMMLDGSFVNVSADLADGDAADTPDMHTDMHAGAVAAAGTDAAASEGDGDAASTDLLELSDETMEVLGLLESVPDQADAGDETLPEVHGVEELVATSEDNEEQTHHCSWISSAGASMRRRLHQVLSTLQAWSTSAYNCLPAFASSTSKLHGKAAGWDWLHFLLTGSLTVVSAALGYYMVRERAVAKKLAGSNAELSKLLFKVISLQQSMQYTGRVPIIRHTSSVSALSTFPLTHLM